jgi:hypothetical protein
MMKKVVLILAIFLVGCSDPIIMDEQLEMATEHCVNRVGLFYIKKSGTERHFYDSHKEYSVTGACNDGTEFTLSKRVKKE